MIWVLNLLMYLPAVIYFGTVLADDSMGTFFPKVANDFSEITWAHGANSKKQLEDAISDDTMMLEADISYGSIRGHLQDVREPIMAHPPEVESDINLKDWLDVVIKSQNKGIKLDFKSTDVLEPSFSILKDRSHEMNFPVWINADILPGPVRASTTPVDAKTFLRLCKLYLPQSTISPGWTTFLDTTEAASEKLLNWMNVYDMVMVLRDAGIAQPITFPVRAAFVYSSLEQLEWLLDVVPQSTLTIWSGKRDQVNVNDLLVLRKAVPMNAVYYDLPSPLNEDFHSQKDHLDNIILNTIPYFSKSLFSIDSGSVILGARTMVLAGPSSVTFTCPLDYAKAGTKIFSTVLEFLADPSNKQVNSVLLTFGESRIEICTNGIIQYGTNSEFALETVSPGIRMFKVEIMLANKSENNDNSMLVLVLPISEISQINEVSTYLAYKFMPESSFSVFKIISADHGLKVMRHLKTDLRTCVTSCGCQQRITYILIFAAFLNYALSHRI